VHQEVFLAVWRRWHKYDGEVNWPAYLYRATVRKALEMARRRVRSTGILPVIPSHGRDAHATGGRDGRATPGRAAHATETSSGPEDALQAEELQQRLAAALARLPRRQADAFVLSRLERLETAEIAGIMGCSEPTVRVHLHRALIRLARELHEFLSP
jgi:RNA polymerase sigma factor (sigma-70 family)